MADRDRRRLPLLSGDRTEQEGAALTGRPFFVPRRGGTPAHLAALDAVTAIHPYRPDPRILELGEAFYDAAAPAAFPGCTPRFLNRPAAQSVGLGDLSDAGWAEHFCRFQPLPDNLQQPLALRYHGHQFRVYNPDIGDGRGFLFAQLRDGKAACSTLAPRAAAPPPTAARRTGA